MKYNARPILHEGVEGYGVFTGKRWWATTFDTDQAAVTRVAAQMSASWHIRQAKALLTDVTMRQAFEIGHDANDLIDVVTDRALEEGAVSDRDSRGWLA